MTDLLPPHPSIVSLMTVCCWTAIVLSIVTVGFTIVCTTLLPGTGPVADFAAGFVQSAGFDPAAFGATEAGEMSSGAVITLTAAAFALVGLRRRRLVLTRISASVWALFALTSAAFLGAALALVVLSGSFVPTAKRWFADEEPSLGSLKHDPPSV